MDVWILLWTVLILIVLRLLYKYSMKPFSYWEQRGVPSVPAIPLLGSLGDLLLKPINEILTERCRKYGRVHGFYESTRPVIEIGEPDLLKDILVKDFHVFPGRRDITTGKDVSKYMIIALRGEEWKRVRTIVSRVFSSGKLKKLTSVMTESAKITAQNFEMYADSGKPVDCKRVLGAFTLDVIAKSAFATTLDSHNDPDNEFVRSARGVSDVGLSLNFFLHFICPRLLSLFRGTYRNTETLKYFTKVSLEILKQRRETGKTAPEGISPADAYKLDFAKQGKKGIVQNDFLQLLMEENDEISTTICESQQQDDDDAVKTYQDMRYGELHKGILKPDKKYKGLTDDELVAQCVLFFLAGYETTASALSFTTYLLALNPECQDRLIKDVDESLQENKGKLTYDCLQSMKYLENVIWESLRIYPPAITFQREAAEDYKLGNTGITIAKGMAVEIPTYAIHHDPEFFEQPETFNPDRFTPEGRSERNPYAFLPFGAGPRYCVAMRFALIEMKFCIAVLMSKFRFKRSAETKVPLEFKKGGQGMLLTREGIIVEVENRKDKMFDI